jgi:hypothetical protein
MRLFWPRGLNYQDVFIAGNVYFTDPDRYARLTRLCVVAYDSERVAQNSSATLGLAAPRHALCSIVDRTPAQVPQFLIFSKPCGQTLLVWQISSVKKVNAACENALTSH